MKSFKQSWKNFKQTAKELFWFIVIILSALLMIAAVIFSILNQMGFRFVINI